MNTRHRQPDSDLSDLSPPEHSGWGLSFWLALLVHVALIVALSLGISWHHDATPVAMQAELWAAVPSEAAPPSAPTSEPTVEPPAPAQPEVTPPPKPAPTPAPSPRPDAKIALEKEQKQKEREKEKKLAQEKHEQELKDKKAKEAKEAEKLAKLKEQAKELAKEQAKEQAKEKAKAEAKAKEEAQKAEAKKAEALRQENLNRMQKLAGANSVSGNGAPGNTGQATRSSGPSGSYAGKVKQRVQPHIAFDAKDTPGNPEAEVEVRTAPDGTITLTKLTKSSGVPAWDNAVLRALDKTQTLPRDEDGRVPPSMILVFRPKD